MGSCASTTRCAPGAAIHSQALVRRGSKIRKTTGQSPSQFCFPAVRVPEKGWLHGARSESWRRGNPSMLELWSPITPWGCRSGVRVAAGCRKGAPGGNAPSLILIGLHDTGPGCPPIYKVMFVRGGTWGAPRVHEPSQKPWFCGCCGGTRPTCARVPPSITMAPWPLQLPWREVPLQN